MFLEHERAINALPPLREALLAAGFNTKKSFGQHFLFDLNLIDKIAKGAGELANSVVLEVGPGPGGLTRRLLAQGAKKVIAIEKDSACIDLLKPLQEIVGERLVVVEGDALKLNHQELISQYAASEDRVKIVANLPYNVGTELLTNWFNWIDEIDSLTLLLQKEVVDRVVAQPNSKAYGRLSILCQYLAHCTLLFTVPPQAFTPPPKVDSAVLHTTPKASLPTIEKRKHIEETARVIFSQRRKMLRAPLKQFSFLTKEMIENAPIETTRRAETLSIEEVEMLAKWIFNQEAD